MDIVIPPEYWLTVILRRERSEPRRMTARDMGAVALRGSAPARRAPQGAGVGSQNKPAQIGVLRKVADMFFHVSGIDRHRLAAEVGGAERDIVKHALHHGL